MNETDIAYLAGLYEGEGTVGCSVTPAGYTWTNKSGYTWTRKKTHARLHFQIRMTDREPLQRIYEAAKGELDSLTLNGPYKKRANEKELWSLSSQTTESVQKLFEWMKPWLSPRRIQQYEEAVDDFYANSRSIA